MSRFFVINLLAAALGVYLASKQGRNWFFWGLLCALFPPSLIILAILPPMRLGGVEARQCPSCGMPNRPGDSACRHCGKSMPIEMVKCPSCGKYVQEGTRCSECGARL